MPSPPEHLQKEYAVGSLSRWGLVAGLLTVSPLAMATPEGTRDLGLNQGLLGNSTLEVFARPGETIRICSSDDGFGEVVG